MCISAATLMMVSAGLTVAGKLYEGYARNEAAQTEADQQRRAAAESEVAAVEEAKRIRAAGKRTQGAARAALAASGVKVDQGTSLLIDEDIGRRTEEDAYNTLLTGQRRSRSMNDSAKQSMQSGQNSLLASVMSAGASAAGGLAGWKSVKRDPFGDFYQRGTRGSGD